MLYNIWQTWHVFHINVVQVLLKTSGKFWPKIITFIRKITTFHNIPSQPWSTLQIGGCLLCSSFLEGAVALRKQLVAKTLKGLPILSCRERLRRANKNVSRTWAMMFFHGKNDVTMKNTRNHFIRLWKTPVCRPPSGSCWTAPPAKIHRNKCNKNQ